MEAQKKQEKLSVEVRIGKQLRQGRLDRKLSIRDVMQELKIRQVYLEDLERGRFSEITPAVYLIGFLRTYSKFLKLDDQEICNLYTGQEKKKPSRKKEPAIEEDIILKEEETETEKEFSLKPTLKANLSSPGMMTVLIATVILVGTGYVWYEYGRKADFIENISTIETDEPQQSKNALIDVSKQSTNKKPELDVVKVIKNLDKQAPLLEGENMNNTVSSPIVEKETPSQNSMMDRVEGENMNNTVSSPAVEKKEPSQNSIIDRIEPTTETIPNGPYLKASEESWIAFENAKSKRLLSKNMTPGELLAVPEGAVFIVIGNAGGANLLTKDKIIKLGRRGEVRRHSLEKLFAESAINSQKSI